MIAEESLSSSTDNNNNSSRALVLDDEPQIGALVCKVLAACGVAAQQFTSPAPFLAELQESRPELVILDLSLGQSDAVEVIRHLEIIKYRGNVLLISGRDLTVLNEITKIGEKRGLAMLPPLKKPFRPADIRQRLAGQVSVAERPKAQSYGTEVATPKKAIVQVVEALRNNWLELWYQPKIDLKSSSVCGAEALIRARHPVLGIITPDKLLPPAGDPDYQPLTKFVIERAIADWTRFTQKGMQLTLSVNAPVSVINSPAFIELVQSALPRDPGFPGLTVEVTEDEVIHDGEWAREIATQLKLYNVELSIDDFGAGYASLSRLSDLPFGEVKIDRSFVLGCASDKLKHGLCQTVIDLAHQFGAKACAEGVETAEDLRALMLMQCDSVQGFLLAKPMPAVEFASRLYAGAFPSIPSLLQAPPSKDRGLARSA